MAISSVTMSTSDLTSILTSGISNQLEKEIRAKLHDMIDPIISQVAREMADKTALTVNSMTKYDTPFGPEFHVQLVFNNQDVKYTTKDPNKPE